MNCPLTGECALFPKIGEKGVPLEFTTFSLTEDHFEPSPSTEPFRFKACLSLDEVLDLGTTGFVFVSPLDFPVGAELSITMSVDLEGLGASLVEWILDGRVTRSSGGPDGLLSHEVRFSDDVDRSLTGFLSSLEAVAGRLFLERRRTFRFRKALPIRCKNPGTYQAVTLDLSTTGLRILTDRTIPAGKMVRMWLDLQDDTLPVFAKGLVKWQSPSGNRLETGVQFTYIKEFDKERLLRYILRQAVQVELTI
ncbi:MAG: PilZ domain-containing protein [Armatimonadetes bacterium]|nr:PilZ domain-containing protein [Armatimonadota bacterium]